MSVALRPSSARTTRTRTTRGQRRSAIGCGGCSCWCCLEWQQLRSGLPRWGSLRDAAAANDRVVRCCRAVGLVVLWAGVGAEHCGTAAAAVDGLCCGRTCGDVVGMLSAFSWTNADEAFWYSSAGLLGGVLKGCWGGGSRVPRSLCRTERAGVHSLLAQWRLDQRKQHAHAYALVGGVTEAHPLTGCLERVRKGSNLASRVGASPEAQRGWWGGTGPGVGVSLDPSYAERAGEGMGGAGAFH
eukprot:COSAG02_NODE_11733_length_1664_cov_1.170498_2_plen_242_part_00